MRAAVLTVMKQHEIAGMAVAVTRQGEQHFYSFGLASWETRVPVTNDTLFEVGSISKTYSATLAAYAQALGRLSLADPVERHVPELAGSAFGKVSLLGLATHTAGGFPLQVPDTVRDRAQLMAYLQAWQPSYAEGTRRTYANPSIGMLGVATANAMGQAYVPLMQGTLLPAGPAQHLSAGAGRQMARYAQGYDKRNQPVRVSPGVLADEAYGVKTSARDLLRFVELNLGGTSGDAAGSGHRRHAPGLLRTGRHDAGPGVGAVPLSGAAGYRAGRQFQHGRLRDARRARCVRRWRRAPTPGSTRPAPPMASAPTSPSCRDAGSAS